MKIRVTVELSKGERRCIARFQSERFGEHGRLASRKQCKQAILHAVNVFLEGEREAGRADDTTDEGAD
jgi:hypothetical protein